MREDSIVSLVWSIAGMWFACASALAAYLPPELSAKVELASQANLPAATIRAKAAEGLAKGVPIPRVAMVLDSLISDLSRADQLLVDAPAAHVSAGASALRAGASDQAVVSVSGMRSLNPVHGLQTLADLMGLGMAESDAVRLVQLTLHTAQPDHAVSSLATAAAAMVARGAAPAEAAQELGMSLSTNPASPGGEHPGNSAPNGNAKGHTKAPGNNGNGNGNGQNR
jgi:hypothetical protein